MNAWKKKHKKIVGVLLVLLVFVIALASILKSKDKHDSLEKGEDIVNQQEDISEGLHVNDDSKDEPVVHFGNDITKDHEISNSTKGEELENSQDNGNDSVNQDNWDETDNSPRTDNSTKDGEWTPLI